MTISMEARIAHARETGKYERYRERISELLAEKYGDVFIAAKIGVSFPTFRVIMMTLDLCDPATTRSGHSSRSRKLLIEMRERREAELMGGQVSIERELVATIRSYHAEQGIL
jgi:hypothetical protein